ncbi:hypothetical protein [Streptomyces tibetensis]|uniref:hypothetical protein n=1 Tax=Streptomyces tibetensis TaxID=2382123 RepID=UPI0033F83932
MTVDLDAVAARVHDRGRDVALGVEDGDAVAVAVLDVLEREVDGLVVRRRDW